LFDALFITELLFVMQHLPFLCRSRHRWVNIPLLFSCFFFCFLVQKFPAYAQSASETLHSPSNRFDYLIITPSQFTADVQAHAQWRSNTSWTHQALRTRVVTLEEINKEFGDSVKKSPQSQAEAIRAFLSHTLQFWTEPRPSRVLLVGSTNLLPAYRAKVTIPLFTRSPYIDYEDSIPMDEWYVVNKFREDFNTRPQAAIGRVPGRTSAEIKRVLGKIRLFEESGNTLGFNLSTRATVILDAEDNDAFDNQVFLLDSYLRYNVGKPLTMDIVNYQILAQQPDAHRQVTSAMSAGRPIVMYYGHGSPDLWSKYKILTTDDVGNNLARNGKPYMLITAGCSQNYDIAKTPSIVEAMMLLENGGAVMTVASSGYSSYPENNSFIRLFFKELSTITSIDVGTAMINAKNALYVGSIPAQDDLMRRIALLGDPALVPFSRLITGVNDRTATQTGSQFQSDVKISPNPASSQTTLRYTLPSASEMRCDIVNLLGQTVLSLSETQNVGEQSLSIGTEALPIGAYLCRLQAGAYHQSVMLTVSR
jgi:hypothetical protein